MISLYTVFWVMTFFFAAIGFMRGWTKEIIAMAGLVLSLFAINQFGLFVVGLSSRSATALDPSAGLRQQFYTLAILHLVITFFSYQGAPLASQVSGGRLGARVREGLQERLLGAVFGGFNGYLIVGTLWSFLEYQMTSGPEKYVRMGENMPYAFDPMIIRMAIEARPPMWEFVVTHLPLPFLAPFLAIGVVLLFVFVIVVII